MRQDPVILSGLAFACFVYRGIYKDDAYKDFRENTNPQCDLNNSNHRLALFEWLRKWGCRHLSKDATEKDKIADIAIVNWYKEYSNKLPDKKLCEMTDEQLALANEAFNNLSERVATHRNNNAKSEVRFRHTAVAKILFALRPEAFPPWDNRIRDKLKKTHSIISYSDYLRHVKNIIGNLEEVCMKHGFKIEELPQKLNRPDSTVPKLIDEYYWITITKECPLPDKETLRRWDKWTKS